LSRRARRHVVDQDRPYLGTIVLGIECLHRRFGAPDGAHLDYETPTDRAVAREYRKVQLQGVDRNVTLVFDDERETTAALHILCRVELDANDLVGWRGAAACPRQHRQPKQCCGQEY